MKKKLILIIFLIFLVTGCSSVNYDLEVSKDLTVVESVNMSGTKEYFDNYYMDLPITVVREFYNNEEWMSPLKSNNYNYELRKDNIPYPSVFATKKYNSLNDYAENTAYKNQVFKDISIHENGNLINIDAHDFNKYLPEDSDGDVDGRYPVSVLKVNIKVPFVVTDSNADSINNKTNTYTWNINEETNDKKINLTFDKSRVYIYNLSWYISLGIIILLAIIILIVIRKVIKKNKNNNGV